MKGGWVFKAMELIPYTYKKKMHINIGSC